MTRLTITLPEHVAAGLKREARRRRVSVSHLVREQLKAWPSSPTDAEDELERRFAFIGIVNAKLPWNAEDIDEELAKTYADDIRRDSFSDRGG